MALILTKGSPTQFSVSYFRKTYKIIICLRMKGILGHPLFALLLKCCNVKNRSLTRIIMTDNEHNIDNDNNNNNNNNMSCLPRVASSILILLSLRALQSYLV